MNWLILLLALVFNILQQAIEAWANVFKPAFNLWLRKIHGLIILFYFLLWAGIVYFLIPNEIPYIKLFLGYWFIAFMVSDIAWNITSIIFGNKVGLFSYGTTKWYDRFMTKLDTFGWFCKLCLGVVGIFFLLGVQEWINSLQYGS